MHWREALEILGFTLALMVGILAIAVFGATVIWMALI